ncbi:hypothetical protein [Deinococcus humi]|uniref:DUF2808 domain-containing protein n=1 Tax=Deinococcus humi TaxID=662880 RepID=A0A7W8K2L1_9DEIO|nr:hypothetical protein [Deinococcus humi]MBB5366423.1 hypothetical protein [Deinococcus humi]GGO41880.1 hypothetical protein GCM10008949_53250 [Deinococcus humi]
MRRWLPVLFSFGLLATTSAGLTLQQPLQNQLFNVPPFPTDFRGPTTPIELHYDVKPSASSGEGPRLILNVIPATPGRLFTRTAFLNAGQRGVWKGQVPKGQVTIHVVHRSCIYTNTLSITGNKAVIRVNYTFNGNHLVENELYVGTTRSGGGTCG